MKFTTITYDANLPTVQQVNVPTNSDYKIGMKVKRNGEVQLLDPDEITIYTGETTIPTDSEKTNDYVTFTQASGDDASFRQLSVVVDTTEFTAKFKLNVNIFKSQVGDIDKDAGGPGTDIDVNSVKTKVLTVNNGTYTVITAESDETENDSGVVNVKGSYAKLRVGGTNDINAVRINANGTTPNVQVGKMGTSNNPAAALSCDTSGHGLLVLDNIAFTGAELSATFAANQILEGLV